jgi:hypothetical protein
MTLDKLNIVNGNVNMKLYGTTSLTLQNASIILNSVDNTLSENTRVLKQAIELMQFKSGIIKINGITARLDEVASTGKDLLHADALTVFNASKSLDVTAKNVLLNNLLINEASEELVINGVNWGSATIRVGENVPGGKKGGGGDIHIQNIEGKNTRLQVDDGKMKVNTYLTHINAASVEKKGTKALVITGLEIGGQELSVTTGLLQLSADNFMVKDEKTSSMNGVSITQYSSTDSLGLAIPAISFIPDVNAFFQKNIHLPFLQLQSPEIKFNSWKDSAAVPKEKKGAASITIDKITVIQPSIAVNLHKKDSVTTLYLPRSPAGRVEINNLHSGKEELRAGSLNLTNNALIFTKPGGEVIGVQEGQVDLQLQNLQLATTGGKRTWSTLVNSLELRNPKEFSFGPQKNRLMLELAHLGNIQLSSATITDYQQVVRNNLAFWLKTANGQYIDSNTTFKWFNAGYDAKKKNLTLDSFFYSPTPTREAAIAANPFAMDYITAQTGKIVLNDFDLTAYSKDSIFKAGTISIAKPLITIYRDKRPPFRAGYIKPLPVDMMKKIPFLVDVKKVELGDGLLQYTELNDKTAAEGTVSIHHLNASVSNIKNFGLQQRDSLGLRLDGYLMDSGQISLRLKESYTDTLSSFLMTLRMKPTTLSFLNPILAPLSNIKIESGVIDSLQLRAIGREHLSLGEMNLYYHNLKIKFLKDGDETQTSFKSRLLTFVANTFFINKNNSNRKGIVYFERLRDRSFISYIIKMTFSGLASSVGAKSNKKYLRRYQKELKQQQLPPIDFDFE